MNSVYENAYCNISDTGAVDSTQGFLFDRRPELLQHTELDLAFRMFDRYARSERQGMFDLFYWQRQLTEMPLHYRGWVVQERLLASRVLHFGSHQLIGECAEMDATEAYPKELPPVLALQAKARFKSLDPSIDGKRLRERAAKDSEPRFFAYELWPRIVVTYTQCMLSNPSDKLIALSGIAKRMRDIIQDEYVAGMWRRYLSNELLWNVSNQRQGNQSPPMRSEQYRAPSFSWASVDGCITVPPISDQGMLCSVEDVWIVYVTDDTTGLIKGESLTLKGTLKRLELRRAGSLKSYLLKINDKDVIRSSDKSWERMGPLVLLDVD